jgi:hypothetical protein
MAIKPGKVEIATLDDGDFRYFSPFRPKGPDNWINLHNTDYGKNPLTGEPLRQQSFPQSVRLFNFAVAHRKNPLYAPIINALIGKVITGDSLLLWTPESFYCVDFPDEELVSQLGVDNQPALSQIEKKLQAQLKRQIGEHVQVSESGLIRYTPSQFIIFGEQDQDTLATNPGNIVVAGTLQDSKGLAKSSASYKLKPFFNGLQNPQGMTVTVPALRSDGFDGRLYVYGNYWFDDRSRCSFGGTLTGEASARKNK